MATEIQRKEYTIAFTFCDEVVNLRNVIDHYAPRNGMVVDPRKRVKKDVIEEILSLYSGFTG